MFNATLVDVAVGLALIYLGLSLLSAALYEWVARLLRLRPRMLERAIRELIAEPARAEAGATIAPPAEAAAGGAATGKTIAERLFDHPLVASARDRDRPPSYLSSRTFAIALLDTIAPGANSFDELRGHVAALPVSPIRQRLESLLDHASPGVDVARAAVARWFDDSMDRWRGVYKRRSQSALFAIGLALALLTNADTALVTRRLQHESTLRAAVTASAQRDVTDAFERDQAMRTAIKAMRASPTPGRPVPEDPSASGPSVYQRAEEELTALELVGWELRRGVPRGIPSAAAEGSDWVWWGLWKLIGLLVTAVAVSLGAPLAFDLVGKLVNPRMTGERPSRDDARR